MATSPTTKYIIAVGVISVKSYELKVKSFLEIWRYGDKEI
jgi:hypothetical protein